MKSQTIAKAIRVSRASPERSKLEKKKKRLPNLYLSLKRKAFILYLQKTEIQPPENCSSFFH
jgi:hypothetical protein